MPDLTTFTGAVDKFKNAAQSLGITYEDKGVLYKATVEYSTVDDVNAGYVTFYGELSANFEAMMTFLEDKTAAETAAGADAYAVRDAVEDNWTQNFSCSMGEDKFTMRITRSYIAISGIDNNENLAVIENWCNTIEEFGGETF